jgi:hypothetical protein
MAQYWATEPPIEGWFPPYCGEHTRYVCHLGCRAGFDSGKQTTRVYTR